MAGTEASAEHLWEQSSGRVPTSKVKPARTWHHPCQKSAGMAGHLWAGAWRRRASGRSLPSRATCPWRRLNGTSCCLRGRAHGMRGGEEHPPQVLVELDGTLGPRSCLLPSWHVARAELAAHLKRELLMCDISLVPSSELGGGRAGGSTARTTFPATGARAEGWRGTTGATAPPVLPGVSREGNRNLEGWWLLNCCWGCGFPL